MKLQHQAEGYLELGMSQQALDVLNRLGDSDDGDADLHAFYLQGEALRGLGRYGEALAALGRVTKAEPENVHAWLAVGWCHNAPDASTWPSTPWRPPRRPIPRSP